MIHLSIMLMLSAFIVYNMFHVVIDSYGNPFQNLYWADSGDLVAIASDTSFYILKYNVSILFTLMSF